MAQFNTSFTECDVTMLVPPKDAVWSMQSYLSHDKRAIVIPREDTIERLNLQTLSRDIVYQLPPNERNYGISGLTLTCDDRMLYFATWHHDAALQPDGRVYRTDISAAKTEYLADITFPGAWMHFLASPTNPDLLSFAYIEEVLYPEFHEAKDRIRLMHLDQTKPGAIATSVLYHNNPVGLPWKRELVTHECWGKNGQYLTFIVRRDKIKRVFVDTKASEIIFKGGIRGPKPWHCDGANGKYYVFDTMNPNSGIWVGKFGEKHAKKICNAADVTSRLQPHHPHPLFSPDVSRVVFNSIVNDVGYLHIVPVRLG